MSIEELAHNIEYERMRKNQVVFDYGSPGDIFYVILSGKVSVKTPMSDFEHQGILFNNCHDFFYFYRIYETE